MAMVEVEEVIVKERLIVELTPEGLPKRFYFQGNKTLFKDKVPVAHPMSVQFEVEKSEVEEFFTKVVVEQQGVISEVGKIVAQKNAIIEQISEVNKELTSELDSLKVKFEAMVKQFRALANELVRLVS